MDDVEINNRRRLTLSILEDGRQSCRDGCTPARLWTSGICFGLLLVASLIMIGCSVSYVEWYQYAMKQNTATNTVYYDEVFENGRYFWGLAIRPVCFNNTLTTVEFTGENSLIIFTEGGLEMNISCSFQYSVIKEELPTLYRTYGTTYPLQIVSIGLSILKNAATSFTMEDYYQNRYHIRQVLFDTLRTSLHAQMNVNVSFFQLDYIELPDIIVNKLLTIAVQNQTNIKEQYVQEAAVVRQTTVSLAQAIIGNATVLNQTAVAQASFLIEQAKAQAFAMVQGAKKEGLGKIFSGLGLNTTDLQLSYLYTTQLAQSASDIRFLVDVDSVIVPTT